MGLSSGGLIIGRIFASEIWGAYFREDLFLGGLLELEFYDMFFPSTVLTKVANVHKLLASIGFPRYIP